MALEVCGFEEEGGWAGRAFRHGGIVFMQGVQGLGDFYCRADLGFRAYVSEGLGFKMCFSLARLTQGSATGPDRSFEVSVSQGPLFSGFREGHLS